MSQESIFLWGQIFPLKVVLYQTEKLPFESLSFLYAIQYSRNDFDSENSQNMSFPIFIFAVKLLQLSIQSI